MKKNVKVICSSHLPDEENVNFESHINQTIGVDHSVHIYRNFNEYSLSKIYNIALKEHTSEDSILVFCHNDIEFDTKDWGKTLLKHFNNPNIDYQILGVAGSVEIPAHGCWYLKPDMKGMNMKSMRGIVNHDNGIRKWESRYSEPKKTIDPVLMVDGLFIAVDPTNIENKFDEDYGMWHYYDMGFCFPNYLDGCNIGVIYDIRITHKSIGQTDKEWDRNRIKFSMEYKDELPIKI